MRRSTGRTPAGRQHYAGIQEQVHAPERKRRIASSSSSIQAWSCSSEKRRGAGSGACCPRRLLATNSSNSVFSAVGNSSTARSISSSVFMRNILAFGTAAGNPALTPASRRRRCPRFRQEFHWIAPFHRRVKPGKSLKLRQPSLFGSNNRVADLVPVRC